MYRTLFPDRPVAASPPGFTPGPSGLRILSLSCVYPNPGDPGLGLFVRSRLAHLAGRAEVKVIAPISQIDYARPGLQKFQRGVPSRRTEDGIEVLHPAWIYPPGGHAANAYLLFLRLLPLVRRMRRSFDFQVIDAHFGFPDGIVAGLLAQSLNVPFTITLRGNETMHARYRRRRELLAWSLSRADRVIALSRRLSEFAVSIGAEAARVKIIPNGVDPHIFFRRDRALCRKKYELHPHARILLSAGTLIERKGHDRVIRAAANLRRRGLDVEVVIAGGPGREGHFEHQIRKEIAALNMQPHVRLLGEVIPDDLAELMSAADLCCLASSREGWPSTSDPARKWVWASAKAGMPNAPFRSTRRVPRPLSARTLSRPSATILPCAIPTASIVVLSPAPVQKRPFSSARSSSVRAAIARNGYEQAAPAISFVNALRSIMAPSACLATLVVLRSSQSSPISTAYASPSFKQPVT